MELHVKKADINSFEDFLLLKSDSNNVIWTGYSNIPNKEKLHEWYNNQLTNPYRTMFLFYKYPSHIVGYLYYDKINPDTIEFAYGVLKEQNGKGFGSQIIKLGIDKAKKDGYSNAIMWIAEKNIGSIKCALKNEFVKTEQKEERQMLGFGRNMDFFKFIKQL